LTTTTVQTTTTTTEEPTTTTTQPTTTTTEEPTTTTEEPTTTTEEPTTTTEEATTTTTEEPTTTTDQPVQTPQSTTTTTELEPQTTEPPTETTTTEQEQTTTTETESDDTALDQPTTSEPQPISDQDFTAAVDNIDQATTEEVVAIVAVLLQSDLTSEQATALAVEPAVLAAIDEQQAHELFDEITLSEIDATTLVVLIDTVQTAPVEVRAAFESEINIFGGYADQYVPIGSAVTVSVRRTLVAASATLVVAAAPIPVSRRRIR
jgi:DNA mismatch repair ATPase MutL